MKRLIQSISVFFILTAQTRSEVFFVTDTNDSTNLKSLRGAVIEANRVGHRNTIILGEGQHPGRNGTREWVFRLTISGPDEGAARTGDLDVTSGNLTIMGAGANVVIDASALGDRVFQVFSNAQLTLDGLVITGGNAPSGSSVFQHGEAGGAIHNAGTLVLKGCVITNNASGGGHYVEGNGGGTGGGDGGGIYNAGAFWGYDSVIAGNSSGAGFDGANGGNGGGIRNDGVCHLVDCTLSRNQAGSGAGPEGNAGGFAGSGGCGGGVFNAGAMTLERCSVRGNSSGSGASGGAFGGDSLGVPPGRWGAAGGDGAGIYSTGTLTLNRCSVVDNSSGTGGNGYWGCPGGNGGGGGNGAGICSAGKLLLNSCVISNNSCGAGGNAADGIASLLFGAYAGDGGAGGNGGNGGGVFTLGQIDCSICTVVRNSGGAGGLGGNGQAGVLAELEFDLTNGTVTTNIIAGNNAQGGRGGNGGTGGVFSSSTGALTAHLRNVVIAYNTPGLAGAGGYNQDTNRIVTPGIAGTNGLANTAGRFIWSGAQVPAPMATGP